MMLNKGIAYSVLYYKSLGLRPMSDLDLLIPASQVENGISVLKSMGWTPLENAISHQPMAHQLLLRIEMQFRNSEGHEIDLHWRLLHGGRQSDTDGDFWSRSQTIDFLGRPAETLCDVDNLLHACEHGARWNRLPPMRWVADAVMIIRRGDIEWPRLLELVETRRLHPFLRDTLSYLHVEMRCPVPDDVLTALRQTRVPFRERDEYRLKALTAEQINLWRLMRLRYYYVRRSNAGAWAFVRTLWSNRRRIFSIRRTRSAIDAMTND